MTVRDVRELREDLTVKPKNRDSRCRCSHSRHNQGHDPPPGFDLVVAAGGTPEYQKKAIGEPSHWSVG